MTTKTVTPSQDTHPMSEALHGAIAFLAMACDGAHKRDLQGFSAADTHIGRYLANVSAADWDRDHTLVGYGLVRIYQVQLARAGVDLDVFTEPDGWNERAYRDAREEIRELAGKRRRTEWLAQQEARRAAREAAQNFLRLLPGGNGQYIQLGFTFDRALVAEAKAITGRSFNWDTKTNDYPLSSLPAVLAFADKHGIPVADEIYPLIEEAERLAAEAATRPHVTVKGTTVWLAADYDEQLNFDLRELNGGHSTWDKQRRAHRVPMRDPQAAMGLFERFGLRVAPEVAEMAEQAEARRLWNHRNSVATTADPIDVPGLVGTLKPHQHAGVRYALANRRLIWGDDMGLGKTVQSLSTVACAGWDRLVIMCKPDLTLNWVQEIDKFFPGQHRVYVCEGLQPEAIPADVDTVIVGFAGLVGRAARYDKADPAVVVSPAMPGWTATLTAWAPTALILDEGHHGKEASAKRSQAMKQIGRVIPDDGLILNLTGTAIVNRPKELLQQLEILGRVDAFGGAGAFLVRYCDDGKRNAYGRSFKGAQNLEELHLRLRQEGLYLRRTNDPDLPGFERRPLTIPADQLDPKAMAEYEKAETDTIAYLAERAAELAEQLGADPQSAKVKAAMKAETAEHLVRLNTLRRLAGRAKLPAITRWVTEQVNAGEQVMVAAHHRDVVDTYARQFGGLKIQGGQAVASKEADKVKFQAGEKPVITVAIGAGACGHTLTAARYGIQAELCWTPGEMYQIGKRIHRIGQTRDVTYLVALAAGTVDEAMWTLLEEKGAVLAAVLDGEEYEDGEKAVAAAVAWNLAQRGLEGE